MKMIMRLVLAATVLGCATVPAMAGYTYQMEVSESGRAAKPLLIKVQDGDLKLEMPTTEENPQGGSMVYLGA